MELIDRNAFRDYIMRFSYIGGGEFEKGASVEKGLVADWLEQFPTVEARPIVHAQWIDGAERFTSQRHNAGCSNCGAFISWNGCDRDFRYCPNCGAVMDL